MSDSPSRWAHMFGSADIPAVRRYDVAALASEIARGCCEARGFDVIQAQCELLNRLAGEIGAQLDAASHD